MKKKLHNMKGLILIILVCNIFNCLAEVPPPPELCEPDGAIGGYEYVDLGLPSGTLWATYNVGATTPYEYGDYFAWGEVEPRDYFTWENYAFYIEPVCDPDNGSWYSLVDIGDDICGTEYDAARHIWGNGWRLPNETERYELRMLCWHKWTEENGVKGTRVYGPNEHSIFLPAGGFPFYNIPSYIGVQGYFWTGVSAPMQGYNGMPIKPSNSAKALNVDSSGLSGGNGEGFAKAVGRNIRPVINPRETGIVAVESDSKNITFQDGCLKINGIHAKCALNVYDLSGRIVFSAMIVGETCHLPYLSEGVYIVSLADGMAAVKTQKIIIK